MCLTCVLLKTINEFFRLLEVKFCGGTKFGVSKIV